jgi:hypothetical protein
MEQIRNGIRNEIRDGTSNRWLKQMDWLEKCGVKSWWQKQSTNTRHCTLWCTRTTCDLVKKSNNFNGRTGINPVILLRVTIESDSYYIAFERS